MNADEKVEHTSRKTSRKARVKDILEENCINCNRVHRHGFLELQLLQRYRNFTQYILSIFFKILKIWKTRVDLQFLACVYKIERSQRRGEKQGKRRAKSKRKQRQGSYQEHCPFLGERNDLKCLTFSLIVIIATKSLISVRISVCVHLCVCACICAVGWQMQWIMLNLKMSTRWLLYLYYIEKCVKHVLKQLNHKSDIIIIKRQCSCLVAKSRPSLLRLHGLQSARTLCLGISQARILE